jgi:transposase
LPKPLSFDLRIKVSFIFVKILNCIIQGKEDLGWRRLYSNKVDKSSGVCCDQVIVLTHWLSSKKYPEKLRRVKYFDQETNRHFVYLTNDFNISAETVAALYKYRWQVELFFKWIKQHLKIKDFWGYSENAVKTQICIAICTYLIVSIARKKLGIERNLYEILQILNVTLLTKNPINTLLSETELQIPNDCSQKQACLLDF